MTCHSCKAADQRWHRVKKVLQLKSKIATTGLINVASNYSINVTLALVSSFKGKGEKNEASFSPAFTFAFIGCRQQGEEETWNNEMGKE